MESNTPALPPLSGRRAEAARNDERILAAARAVFLADPGAPVAAVAARAGVGIAAIYRRYTGKEALLQRLYLDGINLFLTEVEAALADEAGDPWTVFCRFAHRSLAAGTGSLSLRFAGAFAITAEMERQYHMGDDALQQLVDRTQAAGALRPDVGLGDLQWLFMPAQAIQTGDEALTAQLRHRYLALLLDGLHASAATPLPGPQPGGEEYGEYWDKKLAGSTRSGSPAAP